MADDALDPRDETLSAWLDGELAPDEAARVQAWLDALPPGDPRALQLRAWAADRDALRSRFAPVLAEPVPGRLRRVTLGRAARPTWRQAAAVAGLVVAGAAMGALGLLGWQQEQALTAQSAAPWLERAAYAHAVYVPEPRHAVEVGAGEEHLARWLTRRVEVPVQLFDLRSEGFELVGGRLLPDGSGKSAQLMYQDAGGGRVTVYLRRPEPGSREVSFRWQRQGTLGLFYWIDESCAYAIVGALAKDRMLELARAIYEQESQPPARPK